MPAQCGTLAWAPGGASGASASPSYTDKGGFRPGHGCLDPRVTLLSRLPHSWIPLLAATSAALALVLAAAVALLSHELSRLRRRVDRLVRGSGSLNLEDVLHAQAAALERVGADHRDVTGRMSRLERMTTFCLQKVGLVRFNAFPDAGGELSFALALLDGEDNGVVLTSLQGRDDARVYAKPVLAGRSPYALSPEERQAIQEASRLPIPDADRMPR